MLLEKEFEKESIELAEVDDGEAPEAGGESSGRQDPVGDKGGGAWDS
jgi:hypothetical protein